MSRTLLSALLLVGFLSPACAEELPIAPNAQATTPLKAGDALPDVTVLDAAAKPVKLSSYHADGPLVIVFYRGSWCPLCTRHFQELVKVQPEIARLGANMVAISPDTVDKSQANATKLKIPFPLLADSSVTAARAFGLAFTVDDATVTKYKGFGIDLPKASGQDHHALPVPAVYIVDKSGKVTFAHSNPDYSKRLDVQTIVTELKKLP